MANKYMTNLSKIGTKVAFAAAVTAALAMPAGAEELEAVPVPQSDPAPVVEEPAPAAVSAPIVGNTETVSSKPDVDGGIPAETVAVISAAVASVAPAGTQYAV